MKGSYIILDGVRDHIIPHTGKDTRRQMWVALTDLYQSTMRIEKWCCGKLNNIKMNRSKTMTSYLMRVQQARDEFAAVGETVHDLELVKLALNRCVKHWSTFVDRILACQQLLDWSQLWDDFTKEGDLGKLNEQRTRKGHRRER